MVSQAHPHQIVLRSPQDIVSGNAPLILQRDDEDFLDAVLEQCRNSNGRKALRSDVITQPPGFNAYKLYQPIQNRFYVAMVEAVCDQPGFPRLDPQKVEAAGLVLRRLSRDSKPGLPVYEGWMRAGGKLQGWVQLARAGGDDADPSPQFRKAAKTTGKPAIDRALEPFFALQEESRLAEQVVTMFAAAPDICAEAKRTFYYGLVQTASSEQVDAPPENPYADFGPASNAFRAHLSECLRGEAVLFPLVGEAITPDWFDAFETANPDAISRLPANLANIAKTLSDNPKLNPNPAAPVHATVYAVQRFILLLRQLAVEFDAFGGSPESLTLYGELNTIELPLAVQPGSNKRIVLAGEFLKQAAKVILEREDISPRPVMPMSWPALTAAAQSRLANALSKALSARFAALQGKTGRFDEPGARYAVRAFVRLQPEGGCPAKIHWTDYSEPFAIAPWYEGAGAPPVQIPLPDLSDKNLLKSLKPNIAFTVPPALQGLLGNNPKDMLKGEGKQSSGFGIGWLCSFSIPIITICAFIVLNIFLTLFDLFFQWMLFFKICIPYPKKN